MPINLVVLICWKTWWNLISLRGRCHRDTTMLQSSHKFPAIFSDEDSQAKKKIRCIQMNKNREWEIPSFLFYFPWKRSFRTNKKINWFLWFFFFLPILHVCAADGLKFMKHFSVFNVDEWRREGEAEVELEWATKMEPGLCKPSGQQATSRLEFLK